MSANNQLIIYRKDLEWCVKNSDVDTRGFNMVAEGLASLEDAIRIAEKYMAEEEVEYGYRIILPQENK